MAIFVTGDTHGASKLGNHSTDGYLNRFSIDAFPEQQDMTKKDYVIICGDFGGIWATDPINAKESDEERQDLDELDAKPFTTLFIPGNHENYDRLMGGISNKMLNCWFYNKLTDAGKERLTKGYPREKWHGGYVRKIRDSILLLEHGEIFDINGYTCFAFGGARSHDIRDGILKPYDFKSRDEFELAYIDWYMTKSMFRVEGVSWWPQEMPSSETLQHGVESAEAIGSVDFAFSHEAPASDKILLGYKSDEPLSRCLESIRGKMSFRKWFFGHMHINRNMPGNDIAIYDEIIQIA